MIPPADTSDSTLYWDVHARAHTWLIKRRVRSVRNGDQAPRQRFHGRHESPAELRHKAKNLIVNQRVIVEKSAEVLDKNQ